MAEIHRLSEDQTSSSSATDTSRYSISSSSSYSTYGPRTLALKTLLSRSKRLPNKLWDASASGPDYTTLADNVNQLSIVAGQAIGLLNENSNGEKSLVSQQAWVDVGEMADQCHLMFNYIDEVIGTEDDGTAMGSVDSWEKEDGSSIFGGSNSQKEVRTVCALLRGMTLTVGLIGQVVGLAKGLVAHRQHATAQTIEVREDAREIAQNATIQQQVSLLKAAKLVRRLQLQSTAVLGEELSQSPGSPAVNNGMADNSLPMAIISLARFQESNILPALIPLISASSGGDREHMKLIKRDASSRVDELLSKWTNVEMMMRQETYCANIPDGPVQSLNNSMGNMNIGAPRRRISSVTETSLDGREIIRQRRASRQPSVEDDEDDRMSQNLSPRVSRDGYFPTEGPVYEHANEEQYQYQTPWKSSSIPPPPVGRSFSNVSAMPIPQTRAPEMMRNYSSPATIPPFEQDSNYPHPPPSQNQSQTYQNGFSTSLPLPSLQPGPPPPPPPPKPSGMQQQQQQQQQTITQSSQFETASVTSTSSTLSSCPEIPWRRRLEASKWDFRDEVLVKSNTTLLSNVALQDHRTITEMREDWILPEALREMGLKYTTRRSDDDDGGYKRGKRTVMIMKGLSWEEVQQIVTRSSQLLEERDRARESERRERDMEWEHGSGGRNGVLVRRDSGGGGGKERERKRLSLSMVPPWSPTVGDLKEAYRNNNGSRSSRSERDRRDRDGERDQDRERGNDQRDNRRDSRPSQSQSQPQSQPQTDRNRDQPKLQRRTSTSSQKTAYRDGERERRKESDRGRERRDSGYNQSQNFIPEYEDEDGYSTDKTPTASSSSRPRRRYRSKSASRRYKDEYYNGKDQRERRESSGDRRRGSFIEAAKEAGKVMMPAAGLATLVIKGLGALG